MTKTVADSERSVGVDLDGIEHWYSEKTASILRKYGPGPRVHYHTGICARPRFDVGLDELRSQLVAGQEALLRRAAETWQADRYLSGHVLDVGAGLGGGSLFWAQEYGATVDALTVCTEHVGVIERLSQEAGVSDRVRALHGDAHEVEGQWSAAVAIEASCYLDRSRWFANLARALPTGARVFIEDTFVEHGDIARVFDDYWRTRIGARAEYERAARDAGFRQVDDVDVTEAQLDFWLLSIAHTELRLAAATSESDRSRLERSRAWHAHVLGAYRTGSLSDRLMTFERV